MYVQLLDPVRGLITVGSTQITAVASINNTQVSQGHLLPDAGHAGVALLPATQSVKAHGATIGAGGWHKGLQTWLKAKTTC
jgi:hypothetical protein